MYRIIRFNSICVAFSDELVNGDICHTTHISWYFILSHYIIHILTNSYNNFPLNNQVSHLADADMQVIQFLIEKVKVVFI